MHRPPASKGALEQLMHPPTLAYGGGVYAAIHWCAARRTRPERDSLRYMRDIAKWKCAVVRRDGDHAVHGVMWRL
jgi:hypothetical protein